MKSIDRAILEHCRNGFTRLQPLRTNIPQGTLYRHTKRLTDLGWLQREHGYYRTTHDGNRALDVVASSHRWDHLEKLYPPIQKIPTHAHKALFELTLAGIICRQHHTRDDRHPVFVAAGKTLAWKTSLAEFTCHAIKVPPERHIVECGAETGRSLFVRKTASGSLIYKRELLSSPLVVLDDFHAADKTARKALQPLLSGRISVPLENDQITLRAVPFLTLNPGKHKELEKRLGLSPAHIRRAIIVDLDAVQMPDLAKTGDQAVKAAKAYGPITLRKPQTDCSPYLHQMVTVVRGILIPDAYERVDIQLLLNLATGMTAFIPDPQTAMAQVGYNFGILAETLGWSRPGWIQFVTDFTLSEEPPEETHVRKSVTTLAQKDFLNDPSIKGHKTIDLTTPKTQRDPALPSLTLSNQLRLRLAWLEEETGRPIDELLNLLIDHYVKWRKDPAPIATLYKILVLGRALKLMKIEIDSVHRYLIAESKLEQIGCTTDDIPTAIRLLELLNRLPQAWTWDMARNAVASVAYILEAGLDLKDIRTFLSRHRTLGEKGFDLKLVVALDKAFSRVGLQGRRRDQAIRDLVTGASLGVEIGELKSQRKELQAELQGQQDTLRALNLTIKDAKKRLSDLKNEKDQVTRELDTLKAECQYKSSHLEAFEGFVRFLLTRLQEGDPFWSYLEHLLQLHQNGEISSSQAQTHLGSSLFPKFVEFFTHLATEAAIKNNVLP